MTVTHVVVTGGGCAGKSTLVSGLAAHFQATGVRVAVAEEAASRIIADAVPDIAALDPAPLAAVQAAMARHMRDQRHTLGALVADLGGGLVLHDRAELDAVPYHPRPDVPTVLAERDETLRDLRTAYPLVVFCESAPPERYETESNPARYEDRVTADLVAARLRDVWSRHCQLIDAPYAPDPTERVAPVAAAVTALLEQ